MEFFVLLGILRSVIQGTKVIARAHAQAAPPPPPRPEPLSPVPPEHIQAVRMIQFGVVSRLPALPLALSAVCGRWLINSKGLLIVCF